MAITLSLVLAAVTPPLLSRIPLPPDEPDAIPYAQLASPRFQWVVAVASVAALGIALAATDPWQWGPWIGFGTGGVLLAVIDARTGFLPLALTRATWALVAGGVMVAALGRGDPGLLLTSIAGTLGAGGMFWGLWRLGGGLGFGDVRLAALIGTVTGATSLRLTAWSLLLGGLAGVAWGLAVAIRRKADGPFPYGPALVIGPFLALGATAALSG